jgi:hypothetical protein
VSGHVSTTDATTGSRRLDGVVWTSGALAVGCALLAVGHSGLQVPLLSALGPGGTRAVVPAAVAFTVAAVLHTLVSVGVARRRSWAWPLGVLIAAATLLGAATPFRGVMSGVGIVLAGLELGLLLTRDGRRLLRSA